MTEREQANLVEDALAGETSLRVGDEVEFNLEAAMDYMRDKGTVRLSVKELVREGKLVRIWLHRIEPAEHERWRF